jgi:hypothetical protein
MPENLQKSVFYVGKFFKQSSIKVYWRLHNKLLLLEVPFFLLLNLVSIVPIYFQYKYYCVCFFPLSIFFSGFQRVYKTIIKSERDYLDSRRSTYFGIKKTQF